MFYDQKFSKNQIYKFTIPIEIKKKLFWSIENDKINIIW